MGDTTTDPNAGNENQPTPVELTLKHHGQETSVPLDKARDLAQKGLDYEKRLAELKAEKEALSQDSRSYDEYKRLKQYLSTNQAAQQAVSYAIENPEAVQRLRSGRGAAAASDDLDDDADDSVDTAAREDPRVAQMQRELAELRAEADTRKAGETRAAVEQQIRGELESYPWLTETQRNLAYKQVASHLASNPDDSLVAATAVVASDFKKAYEELAEKQLARAGDRSKLRTTPPRHALPATVAPPPKLTKKAWRDGSLISEGMRIAREMGITE